MSSLHKKAIHQLKENSSLNQKDIAALLGCAASLVTYHLSERSRTKSLKLNVIRRRKAIRLLKEEHGGGCLVCGYNKCMEALEFDHLEPNNKAFSLASNSNLSPEALRKEADKCVLLCANHHRERHAGVLDLGAYLNLEPEHFKY